jgi:hypothetical protein
LTDAVEKGICRNLEATLIQNWKPMRNLDSRIQLPGFVCFKFQFHIFFAETFRQYGRVEDERGSFGHSATLRFTSPLIEPDVPD